MQNCRFPKLIRGWIGDRSVRQAAIDMGVVENTLHGWMDKGHLPPSTRIPVVASKLGMSEQKLRKIVAADRKLVRQS